MEQNVQGTQAPDFKEIFLLFKETDRKFKKTAHELREMFAEIWG